MPANCTVHPSSGGGLVNGSSSLSGKTGPSPPNLAFLGMFLSVFASLCVTIGLALQKRVHKRLLEEGNSKRKYYQVPLWWAALILIMSDAFIDMATFGMAPQSLLAPLGAASLVWNTPSRRVCLASALAKLSCWAHSSLSSVQHSRSRFLTMRHLRIRCPIFISFGERPLWCATKYL